MQGYEINNLNGFAQVIVKRDNIDKNNNGVIDVDNGELALLLSKTGKNNINDLLKSKKADYFMSAGFGLGAVTLGTLAGISLPKKVSKAEIDYTAIQLFKRYGSKLNVDKKTAFQACLHRSGEIYKEVARAGKVTAVLLGICSALSANISAYLALREPQ